MRNKKGLVIVGLATICVVMTIIIFLNNNSKVSYTKEFAYLPKYKNMQVETFEDTKDGQFGNAVYTLKGVKYKTFLSKYEKVLIRDGWKVAEDKKPESIEVTKGDHIARINAVDSKSYITILLWTK